MSVRLFYFALAIENSCKTVKRVQRWWNTGKDKSDRIFSIRTAYVIVEHKMRREKESEGYRDNEGT